MCRWMAWYGQPVLIEELLLKPKHGLIDQSRHARMGVETTNGDGFGLGWYGGGDGPGLYRSIAPAWGDENLRELAAHIESPLFIAHVRATTGTAIQHTNCHPFRHGNWLFVHNGAIAGIDVMRRDLVMMVDPSLYTGMVGSTDSEVVFHLALTHGLQDDPIRGLERAVGAIEETARRHGVQSPVQATFGISDGTRLWAIRYASSGRPRSLFASSDVSTIRRLYPDNERLQMLRDEDRIVLSEPLVDLPGLWDEVPESTALVVQPGPDEHRPFRPHVEHGVAVPA
jgi:predicted glutamine amidotransferase